MSKIPLTNRQYDKLSTVNNQIASLAKLRQDYLELIIDASEAAGKNIKVISIQPDHIEYEDSGPQLTAE